jgi:excisionase family DNA binding protein
MSTTAHSEQQPPLFTPPEAAAYLQVPLRTLDAWRYRNVGPRWLKVGRHVRYRRDALDAFLAACEVAS